MAFEKTQTTAPGSADAPGREQTPAWRWPIAAVGIGLAVLGAAILWSRAKHDETAADSAEDLLDVAESMLNRLSA